MTRTDLQTLTTIALFLALQEHSEFKKSYEVIEKLLLGKRSALSAEQEESVAESLKALTTLQAELDPESEEYFLAQLFQKLVLWVVQSGVSKATAHGMEKLLQKG
ncbi:hypothetical protein HPB52_018898 [Rhipicephalus sanguineus]|uniref:Uncharacterized protein n=1 Tax=Rhipicephalus sanguineus TaxID=34632 RepID=A0A9D4Q1T8_RHISA|nr:hypothetical protein HPB52_018898 [Rhipicephalus sanguineus]